MSSVAHITDNLSFADALSFPGQARLEMGVNGRIHLAVNDVADENDVAVAARIVGTEHDPISSRNDRNDRSALADVNRRVEIGAAKPVAKTGCDRSVGRASKRSA